jgi:hypothetical protein
MHSGFLWRIGTGLAVLSALLPAGASAQGHVRTNLGAGSYFPLRVGNSWTYQRSGPGAVTEWTATVASRQTPPRAFPYFVLSGYFPGPDHEVRADPFGTVTEESSGYRDFLWYLLGAREGTSWTIQLTPSPLASPIPGCLSDSRLTLASRGETVQVQAGEFAGVVRVDWKSPCMDAGITSEWFAPGVGLIRRQETSIAGPVTSELVRAELGDVVLPRGGFTTTLVLGRSTYVNNLMPPVGPGSLPVVAGVFTVADRSEAAISLAFTGCKSVSLTVLNDAGEAVLTTRSDDGGCCACDNVIEWNGTRGPLVIPFGFKLATEKGEPLVDGRYSITATLDTHDPEAVRPSARAAIDLTSTH